MTRQLHRIAIGLITFAVSGGTILQGAELIDPSASSKEQGGALQIQGKAEATDLPLRSARQPGRRLGDPLATRMRGHVIRPNNRI